MVDTYSSAIGANIRHRSSITTATGVSKLANVVGSSQNSVAGVSLRWTSCSSPSPNDVTNEEFVTLDGLLREVRRGNKSVLDIIERAGKRIGVAVATLLNLCNPAMVVLAGPLSQLGHFILEPVKATIRERALPVALNDCDNVLGELGSNAGALGAVDEVIPSVFSAARFDTLVGQL